MTRRYVARTMIWTLTVFFLAGPAELATARDPNLLVIQTDEHNFRTLGSYRDTLPKERALVWGSAAVVTTPNIDWLAKKGALCTKFYATTPVCSPSRGALISGRYPQNTPVVTNNIPLADNIVTFAEILRRKGYATGYAGKWHLDGTGKPQWAPKRKFGFEDNRYMFNRGHWKQLEIATGGPRVKARDARGRPNYDAKGADPRSFTTDFLADRTVDFIEAHRKEPFCFMLSIPDPHGPNTVRPPYDTQFLDLRFEEPRTARKSAANLPGWAQGQGARFNGASMARYFGMVKCIDDNVGKILDTLRQHDLLDHTVVVFTSDHGDLCGEHGRHNKGVPLEASAKIPFILHYPEKVPAGTRIDEALSCVDFLPTVASLMGFAAGDAVEGRDASALFTTGTAPAGWKDIAFLRGTGGQGGMGWLTAVTSRYKLVYSPRDEPWLLDLQVDPDETRNFFGEADYRHIVRDLSRDLLAYGKRFHDPYVNNPRIRSDLAWAIGDSENYTPPAGAGRRPAPGEERSGKKSRRGTRRRRRGDPD